MECLVIISQNFFRAIGFQESGKINRNLKDFFFYGWSPNTVMFSGIQMSLYCLFHAFLFVSCIETTIWNIMPKKVFRNTIKRE